ncbi:MAG: metallophosphoesterase [Firmicutes bacterium]|nr:metallophosphoesterase [Bacillota bacterium]
MKNNKKKNGKKFLLTLLALLIIIFIVFLYALFIGSKGLKVKEYKLEITNLPKEYHGLKIAHISDIHYGETINKNELKNLKDKVNSLKPDIIVFTGDISTDGLNKKQIEEVSKIMSEMKASIGKYAINGNHDYKFKKWDILIDNSGFTNLNDTFEIIYKNESQPIMISGISTNLYGTKNIKDKIEPIMDYLNSFGENSTNEPVYSILLLHEPDFIEEIDYNKFDLVLSGHSHNGQVRIPFIGALYTPVGAKKYYDEYYKIDNTDLYISSGVGTTLLGVRLFNKPSFNFYRITTK